MCASEGLSLSPGRVFAPSCVNNTCLEGIGREGKLKKIKTCFHPLAINNKRWRLPCSNFFLKFSLFGTFCGIKSPCTRLTVWIKCSSMQRFDPGKLKAVLTQHSYSKLIQIFHLIFKLKKARKTGQAED